MQNIQIFYGCPVMFVTGLFKVDHRSWHSQKTGQIIVQALEAKLFALIGRKFEDKSMN